MISMTAAYLTFGLSLAAIGGAQLLVKWRFGVLGFDRGTRSFSDVLGVVLGDPGLWLAGVLIVVSALGWYVSLIRLPLSFMMPTAAIVAPLVALGAHLLLGETVKPGQMAAIAVIAAGVAWLGAQQAGS
jgi:drug/metabolite transporter (DMT)-like permease